MTPIREQIIAALAERLSAERANSIIDALPARSLWDGSDGLVERNRYGGVSVTTEVTVETVHQADRDHRQWSTQGNTILAELISTATGADRTLDGLCEDIAYTGGTIYYPEEGSDIIGVDLVLAVRWSHAVGDPYTQ
ncbi:MULTISPECIES: hypothetical protein [unclassified Halomonas]|uniref:hypothetical protein n=1 Tax=unclassified Halomonas TaxID=2609666 RepID=UPI0007D9212C|nr:MULTISPECIES: hypothetical protein [unclassified Halomonas]MBT2788051.1 hypothetical protein [Halomonas sp. ISL-106]MBT2795800.1 hypothetical protein [Halomonas sp. ISL-104]OAL61353.1 hypothetical protein A6R74_15935 [Halomonas sp. ALS9]